MPSVRREGEKQEVVWNWGSHVDRMIREAQQRGDFDNLPGAGKPLNLEDDVFAGEMAGAFRVAKNANAAPLWVQLDKEIGEASASLAAMLERTARYLEEHAERVRNRDSATDAATLADTAAPPAQPARRWWPFGASKRAAGPAPSTSAASAYRSIGSLEAERQRARALYLKMAAELDEKIDEYNSQRPRNLTWLEKTRLLPAVAARAFDERIPPFTRGAA